MSIQHVSPSAPIIGTAGGPGTPHQAYPVSGYVALAANRSAASQYAVTNMGDNRNAIITISPPNAEVALTAAAPFVLTVTSNTISPTSSVLAYIVNTTGPQFVGGANSSLNISFNGSTGAGTVGPYTSTFVIGNSGASTGAFVGATNAIKVFLQVL